MGSSIVGKPTCASTEPSTNSTNACTTDCGCTTTSTAGYGNANRKCASITSSALLTRVAESTRSEEHTSELQSQSNLVCRLLLEKKKKRTTKTHHYTQCTLATR